MTDFLTVPPPPEGLQLAMRTARRRRLRTASVTTGFGASLALVVPLLLGSTGQSSVLLPEPDVQQPAVTTSEEPVVPVPSQAVAAGQPNTAPGLTGGAPGGTGATSVALGATPTPSAERVSGPARSVGSSRPMVPYVAGPMRRTDDQYGQVPCIGSGDQTSPTGLCTSAYEYATGSDGHTYALQGWVCNFDTSAAPLTFEGANEVDLSITSARGDTVWTWSHWHPQQPRLHHLTVQPGACTEWEFPWTQVDTSGNRVPPGTYTLTVTFLTHRLQAQTTQFSLS